MSRCSKPHRVPRSTRCRPATLRVAPDRWGRLPRSGVPLPVVTSHYALCRASRPSDALAQTHSIAIGMVCGRYGSITSMDNCPATLLVERLVARQEDVRLGEQCARKVSASIECTL